MFCRTVAISGSRPYAIHTARFRREFAGLPCYGTRPISQGLCALANFTARKFRRQRRPSQSTIFSRTTSIRFARRQGGPIPMDAAMPDTSRTAAGRELQAFFLNRHRTQPSGIAAAHQATFASRPTSPTNHARPSNYHGRCFKLSKHAMGHNNLIIRFCQTDKSLSQRS